MNPADRAAVRARAANACEYCQRRQIDSPLIPLQIEHVIARKHGGGDNVDNLALACAECNLHKSSDLTGIDPETKTITPLFHPRRQNWADHFAWDGLRIIPLSAVGRTTIQVLNMNSPERIRVRIATRFLG